MRTMNKEDILQATDRGLSVFRHYLPVQFRIGKMNRFLHVIYPQLRPFLFSGLASATGFGWRAIIMGEVLSQCAWGIGSEMKKAQNFIAVPELLAWTIAAIIISILFDKGIGRLAKITPPKVSTTQSGSPNVLPYSDCGRGDGRDMTYWKPSSCMSF